MIMIRVDSSINTDLHAMLG